MTCITDFLQGKNASEAIIPAVKAAVAGDRILCFPQGEYHFYPEGCSSRYCYFSNNDEGIKSIAILLDGIDDFKIQGENAKLIFHGRISPLCAFDCRNLSVSGLSVDFEDSFVSDADLIRRDNGIAWFRFGGKHQVRDGEIIFTDDACNNMNKVLYFHSYDREKQEVVYDSCAIGVPNRRVIMQDGLVGLEDRFAEVKTDAFVVKHELRLCPGMVFDGCENVLISNVAIYHAAGMGFLIQKSENASLDSVTVAPNGRRASVSDDALHITDCRGKLRIANSYLAGTLDDSINVHGVFRKLKSRIPGGEFYYLEAGHYQQQGVFNIRPGDTMELFERKNGKPYAQIRIDGVTPINKAIIKIEFNKKELPEKFVQGDPVLIRETLAELEVVNTVCQPLSGRGVLASGMKSVKITDCSFHTSGAGIFISGDHSFWYESGPVDETVIENNIFDNCNYHVFVPTQEPLAVFPELMTLEEDYFYHGSIKIRNNRFKSAKRALISVMSAREAEVTGNVFEKDDRYPFVPDENSGYSFVKGDAPMAAFLHCKKSTAKNNQGFLESNQ